MKKVFIIVVGLCIGIFLGFIVLSNNAIFLTFKKDVGFKKEVIGFLPYWLSDKADKDYSPYITTLAYFSLTLDTDGTILKLNNPQEEEPGWNALTSGKMDSFFVAARKNNLSLSLVVFMADNDAINVLLSDPISHAKNLITSVSPIMDKYDFSDLNLDIESTTDASDAARLAFTRFAKELKKGLEKRKNTTLTVDITGDTLIKKKLIIPQDMADIADRIVIMGYDYHYSNSFVTGPVAPLGSADTILEYDVQTAVKKALTFTPPEKIILGVPLYGYQWETINNNPHTAVIPRSGIVASNRRVEELLASCATCSAQMETDTKEPYLIYKDPQTGTYYQYFYPDKNALSAKVAFATKYNLGGIALWALGYEGNTILEPLKNY